MGRNILRVLPLLACCLGAVACDCGWLFKLLGWQESPYTPLHSMALIPVLLIVGIAPMGGLMAILVLKNILGGNKV